MGVADFEGFGRGMKTETAIKEGDIAVTVPKQMILNIDTAYADEKLGIYLFYFLYYSYIFLINIY